MPRCGSYRIICGFISQKKEISNDDEFKPPILLLVYVCVRDSLYDAAWSIFPLFLFFCVCVSLHQKIFWIWVDLALHSNMAAICHCWKLSSAVAAILERIGGDLSATIYAYICARVCTSKCVCVLQCTSAFLMINGKIFSSKFLLNLLLL